MRLPSQLVRYLLLGLVLAFASSSSVWADSRSEARTHYQAGVKAYNGNDYKVAIREFSAAQQLAPADLNNYNLALCYDKLGDPEPAIEYYRAYLEKNPGTEKRAEIDASIQRLESAQKSVAAKKADEARKAEEARKTIEAKRAAEEAKKAEDAARAAAIAEEARRKAEEAEAKKAPKGDPIGPVAKPDPLTGAGSTGTPTTGTTVITGDAQLDRVQQIDINQIRDQRIGGAASGIPDRSAGPAAAVSTGGGNVAEATPPANGATPTNGTAPTGAPLTGDTDKPKATPVYKKWWFWAVVGVSLYVVYSIAKDNSSNTVNGRMFPPIGTGTAPQQSGGMTLMRW